MIYLDNAATSWPKPKPVKDAMARFLDDIGGNPGRSGHTMSVDAGRVIFDTRDTIASIFNAPDPLRIIFTMNATHALNIALLGLLKPGDRVVTTSMEHNSVMRPLNHLRKQGISVEIANCSEDGRLDYDLLRKKVNPRTRLVVVNHASNVVGTIQDIAKAAEITHEAGSLLLVDAAQTAGSFPIDVQAEDIDLLAFSGHKGLLGPSGTGGLVIGEKLDTKDISPLIYGGTGSMSETQEQPEFLPDKFESGTPNGVGVAGLGAGIGFVSEQGVSDIREHEIHMTAKLLEGLMAIDRVKVYGTRKAEESTAVVSFTIDGLSVSDAGLRLAEDFGIMCRVGLHCAPSAHRTIGTFPTGTIRFAPGIFTTDAEIETAITAVREISIK